MSALRDAKVLWPLDELWRALQHLQRLELGSGIALIGIALVIAAVRRSER